MQKTISSKLIHEQFSPDAKVKVNIKVEVARKSENPKIKGKAIPGISVILLQLLQEKAVLENQLLQPI